MKITYCENYVLHKFLGTRLLEVVLLLKMHFSYVWSVWDHNDVQYIFNYGNYLS